MEYVQLIHFAINMERTEQEHTCNAGNPDWLPGRGRPLEEEMAASSSILAWKIPWTEVPGGLQSMGPQRVGHNLLTKPPHIPV